jgi:hypothetical protein
MKLSFLTLATLAILSPCNGRAEAGVLLAPHGEASISGPDAGFGYGFNQTADGDTTFLSNSASIPDLDGSAVAGSAISHTVPNYNQFVGGQASSTAINPGMYAYTVTSGTWRDVLLLNGAAPLPSAVTFHFTVEGTMADTYTTNPGGRTAAFDDTFMAYALPPSTTGFIDVSGPPTAIVDVAGYSDGRGNTNVSGFDSFTGTPSSFIATFSYTANYDPTLGGYGFQVTERAQALAYGYLQSSSFVEWNDPLTADFVTNTDGTPLSAFTRSFDSGLQLPGSVTPEPSTLTLFSIGAIGLTGYRLRRRKSRAAATC